MKIRTRLKIIISVLVIFLTVLITVDIISSRQLRGRIGDLNRIAKINILIFQLNVLTSDYLIHFSERSMQQWWSVHKKLGVEFESLKLKTTAEEKLYQDIFSRYQELARIFSTLVQSHEMEQFASRATQQLHNELQDRETTRLLLIAQHIQRDMFHLRHLANQDISRTEDITSELKFALELLFLIFIIANSFFIRKNLVGPIEEIHKGTEIVGQGDFDHRIPLRFGKDEISGLTKAFNTMTHNLKSVTASRDELDKARAELASQAEQLKN